MIVLPDSIQKRMRTVQVAGFWTGLVCLAASGLGGAFNPGMFFPAYLCGFVFWIGLTLGSLAVLMLHYQVGGSWGYITRRILEAAMATLPLMALLFLPLLFGLGTLYPWARSGQTPDRLPLQHLEGYMNPGFFAIRAAVYFACWMILTGCLRRWSLMLDRNPDPGLRLRLRRLSGGGLLLYALTTFFASVDWVMSIEAPWASSIVGLIQVAGQSLSAFALIVAVLVLLSTAPPLAAIVTPGLLIDLGNLLLAAVMLWSYVAFSQYLIIWSGNLPREVPWVLHRQTPGWAGIALVLVLLHFAVPMVLLLFRAVKSKGVPIAALGWMILGIRLVDTFWQIVPSFEPDGLRVHWTQIAAPAGIGGLWIALFIHRLRQASLLPLHEPEFSDVLEEAHAHA